MPLQELTREFAEAIARQHPTLQTLSLARNALTHVPFLELLPPLCRLDLSANALRALPAETAQWGRSLNFLDLSDNALESLQQLRFCRALVTLRVGGNRIALFSELKYLQSLDQLQELTLERNPIAQQPFYRREVVAMLPQLQRLDDRLVTPAERLVASLQQKPIILDPLPLATGDDVVEEEIPPVLDLSGTSNVWATPESPLGVPSPSPSASPSAASSLASSVISVHRRVLLTPAALHQTVLQPTPVGVDVSVQAASSLVLPSEPDDDDRHKMNEFTINTLKPLSREPTTLLQSRVVALESILALHDKTLTEELAQFGTHQLHSSADPERAARVYTKLLATWRRKVVALMVQLKSTELQSSTTSCQPNDTLDRIRNELTRQLEIWKQRCTDAVAQRDLERVRAEETQRQCQAVETKVVRVVRTLASERERVRSIAEEVALFAAKEGVMTTHMDALAHETRRLMTFETRLRLLSERLQVASHLVAHREARLRNSEAAIEAERRILQHKTAERDANSSRVRSRRAPLLLIRPATEEALRLLFHRLDPYHTGLVATSKLLGAIQQDSALRDAMGGGNTGDTKREKLAEHVEKQVRERSPFAGISGTLTWGEVMLMFMPTVDMLDPVDTTQEHSRLVLTLDELGTPPPFDEASENAGADARATKSQRKLAKRGKQALLALSKQELVTLVTSLQNDRDQLQRRVLEDAQHLQRRVQMIEKQWEQKINDLVRSNDELHNQRQSEAKRAIDTEKKLEDAERAAGEAQYQLQSLRRQLSEQTASFAKEKDKLEAQRIESVEREQHVWQRELQDMAFQQTQLKSENTKLELSLRQLERELAKHHNQHERNESARVQLLEEKISKRDDEIAKLRRERNTILTTLREQEKKLAQQSLVHTTEMATQTETNIRSMGIQATPTEPSVPDRRMRLDEITVAPPTERSPISAVPSSRIYAQDLHQRLRHLESLTESLLADG